MPTCLVTRIHTVFAIISLSILSAAGCVRRPADPVDVLKAMIPKIEAALNHRNLAVLQSMATVGFESNRLVVDVFGGQARDSVDLALKHILLPPGEAHMELIVSYRASGIPPRRLTLDLKGNGRWKIDRYTLAADTSMATP